MTNMLRELLGFQYHNKSTYLPKQLGTKTLRTQDKGLQNGADVGMLLLQDQTQSKTMF